MTALDAVPDAEQIAQRAAERVTAALGVALEQRGQAHLALAGGNTPKRAYELLGQRDLGWDRVTIWFGDERAVGPDDPDSNYGMASETLLARPHGSKATVRRIEGERGPEEAARLYAEALRAELPVGDDGWPLLDLALQGIGPDGHTASLFPGNPALAEREQLCVAVHDAPKPPPDRITLTLPVLKAARLILFLAAGEGKAGPVAAIVAGPDPAVPASLLAGPETELIVDEAAAPDPTKRL